MSDTIRLRLSAQSLSAQDAKPKRDGLWQRPYLLLSLATLLWASNFVVGRAIPDSLVPVSLSFWRWVLALPIALPFAWPHLRRDWSTIRRRLPILLLLAGAGVGGSNTLAYLGLRTTPATVALLIQSAIPVAILAFGFLMFRDRPEKAQIAAMAFACAGVLLVIQGQAPAGSGAGQTGFGSVLIVGAMLAQAFYATILRRAPAIHPVSLLFTTFALAALLLLPFQLAFGTSLPLDDAKGMEALIYLATGPSILAFFVFNRGVALIGSGKAGIFFYLMPVFGTLLAVPILGESIGMAGLAGFALVGIGFALTRLKTKD
ncbi:DMT family transporter [Altericroceibacterium endophyticum]|uniref:EamA family transporter n=1 Tax=Altericroceibacterium endophyticum TaxID=1808508 RepID=A0A6I4T5P7_9SPHN|nr:DMT family transporter [Altericroceibacterium endophyticum]MXO66177.1 EamA family transporter [Altericroceibacterium endophyticum]